jgi:hypothetical protein
VPLLGSLKTKRYQYIKKLRIKKEGHGYCRTPILFGRGDRFELETFGFLSPRFEKESKKKALPKKA